MAGDDTSPHETSQSGYSSSSRGTKRKADSAPLEQTSHSSHPGSSSPRKPSNISTTPPTLTDARDKLLKKYGCVAEKPVSEFLYDHVPHVAATVVERVMAKLKEKWEPRTKKVDRDRRSTNPPAPAEKVDKDEANAPLTSEGKVYGYAAKSPSMKKKKEAGAFEKLCSFIKAVAELAAKLNGTRWVDHSSKQGHISGEIPNTSRPDSFLHLIPRLLDDLGWEQILITGELKKRKFDSDVLDNWAKVLWGMHHIMRNDPCRLFTFGYSIEDDQARLWYHARSSVFVSETFKWIDDPKPLVTLILALTLVKSEHFSSATPQDFGARASAPPSASGSQEEDVPVANEPITFFDEADDASLGKAGIDQLYTDYPDYLERIGIDTKMKRVLDEAANIQYEITVNETVFVTEEILCDFKADHATGRCTRVWVVYRKEDDRSIKFVLKDVWLEEGAVVEGDKLKRLKKLVELDEQDHGEVKVKKWYDEHLLHMYMDETLDHRVLGVSGQRKSIRFFSETSERTRSSSIHSGSQRAEPRGGPSRVLPLQQVHVFDDPNRFHYRIVFHGRMTPLELAPCRKTSLEVVIGILRACWVLWTYGMVHRDVSSWNAYWDPSSRTGRLGDYDYLIDYGGTGTGTIKTGTPHFWSVEVEVGKYLFKPVEPAKPGPGLGWDPLETGLQVQRPKPASIFQHNVLHDLESVYWVSLWTYLYLVGVEDRDVGQDNSDTVAPVNAGRQELYQEIFPEGDSDTVHLARTSFLGIHGSDDFRDDLWNQYSTSIKDDVVSSLINHHFWALRSTIATHFRTAELGLATDVSIPYGHVAFVHGLSVVYRIFCACRELVKDFNHFPVSPLLKHQYVLIYQHGPNDVTRWPDSTETTFPRTSEQAQPVPSGSTAFPGSSRSSKRQRMDTESKEISDLNEE
ncbi:hypothetical protein PM082_013422 [Marasmius tenuissimus]|nr:hypothetical protein PM082_013422 [Marasmius tenuissimus]